MCKRLEHPSLRPPRRAAVAAAVIAVSGCPAASAQEHAGATPFELGTITVTAPHIELGEVGADQVASVVTVGEMRKFNRDNIADALNLLPGVTLSHGQKNERRISIRGFETSKIGLFIDGIPVYIPFDGAVDMNRFTTADLAAIQVAKGFTSMAYGPNAMSGIVNLVTRKPTKELEGDAAVGFGEGNERQARINVGTNLGAWYLQGGISYVESDWFRMSSDFKPNEFEDGGHRSNSYREDQKVSLKIGLAPNATDEYALSYVKQEGEKGQPTNTLRNQQFWRWPYWDKESVYLNTRTAFGDRETLKIRAYYDTFDNAIDMYTDRTFTKILGTGPSIYNDQTIGGSVELESTRIKDHTLRLFFFYKKDIHDKNDYARDSAAFDRMEDTLISYALENNYQIRPNLLLSLGVSHHELEPNEICKSDSLDLMLPGDQTATDYQAGLFYDWSEQTRFYVTASNKTRLPSLSDRYNANFSRYRENPDLQAEESLSYEIGYQGVPWRNINAEAAIFRSEVKDKIQDWNPNPDFNCGDRLGGGLINLCQRRNIGKVRYQGGELSLRAQLTPQFGFGGNYTWLDPKNLSNAEKILDVPKRKVTAYAMVRPIAAVDIVAFAENNSKRWVSNTVEIGSYTTLNLKAAVRPLRALTLEAGVNNATDRNYSLASGFPQPGRMWFANATYTF